MAYSRGYQQQSPSPWASGAPPYLQQQQMQQHHPVMPQHQLQGYGPPDFSAPGPYGQPGPAGNYSSHMSYGRAPYVPMARTGSFGGAPAMQQQRQPVQSGNRTNFGTGVANKRLGVGFDSPSAVKRNRPANGNNPSASSNNNRNMGGNRANNVPNQAKTLNMNNRNVQANGTNQQNNSNNNKNRNQQNKAQNQQNKQQNQQNKQQNQQNKQKGKDGNEGQNEVARHIVPFNGFMCKLCTVYMKDKAARTEHLKDENHKIRVAEFDAGARKADAAAVAAAPPVTVTVTVAAAVPAAPAAAVDAVPAAADDAVAPVENKSPVKEAPVTPSAAPVAAEKTCGCSQTAA